MPTEIVLQCGRKNSYRLLADLTIFSSIERTSSRREISRKNFCENVRFSILTDKAVADVRFEEENLLGGQLVFRAVPVVAGFADGDFVEENCVTNHHVDPVAVLITNAAVLHRPVLADERTEVLVTGITGMEELVADGTQNAGVDLGVGVCIGFGVGAIDTHASEGSQLHSIFDVGLIDMRHFCVLRLGKALLPYKRISSKGEISGKKKTYSVNNQKHPKPHSNVTVLHLR